MRGTREWPVRSGYAGACDKGERVWGGTSGAKEVTQWGGRIGEFVKQECNVHTIFIDNFPETVMKGEIFKEFWRFGIVRDVYVSRKQRRNTRGPFAFVRFARRDEAYKATKEMNGSVLRGKKLHVTLSRYRREENDSKGWWKSKRLYHGRVERMRNGESKAKLSKRWVPTGRVFTNEKMKEIVKTNGDKLRRENVKGCWTPEMLNYVRIRICKEVAAKEETLLVVFDEIRPHPDHFSGSSRRVWVEVMGLPVYVWSESTFRSIAKLWGGYVYADNRTEDCASFTVARFLMDCFEWEFISEWVLIKVDDRQFEVFVKEFGAEVYSRESHPNEAERKLMNVGPATSNSESRVEETPCTVEESVPEQLERSGLVAGGVNHVNILEKETGVINEDNDVAGGLVRVTMHDDGNERTLLEDEEIVRSDSGLKLDQIGPTDKEGLNKTYGGHSDDQTLGQHVSDENSCPYLPGFGPCSESDHIHQRGANNRVSGEDCLTPSCHVREKEIQSERVNQVSKEDSEISEALKTKKLCEIGGLSFKISMKQKEVSKTSSDDNVVLAKLIGKRKLKSNLENATGRKPRPTMHNPSVGGRNLSTKIMRLGSKTKLK
ncbi:hypothetical protein PIB30_033619 [Stylosanthes scabra]|uniref:RRM domain-containing protein n=1 Tax=Stylosanthes scabra TaxID=79078 RepID=A0ABU6QCX7_9FABA|nr:hypothetical protein [Stylosanthes scabra]